MHIRTGGLNGVFLPPSHSATIAKQQSLSPASDHNPIDFIDVEFANYIPKAAGQLS